MAPAAVSLSAPALAVPPSNRSAISVVVKSMTPSNAPFAIKVSIVRPPAPFAGKAITVIPACSRLNLIDCTAGVVTPKAVTATVLVGVSLWAIQYRPDSIAATLSSTARVN